MLLVVGDQGIGIPHEHLERIFDPFFTTKGHRGTGLGLSMAYSVMRRLGGSISADNLPDGAAAFTLRFPTTHEAPAQAAQPATSAAPPGGTKRILLVDDDPDNLQATETFLEVEGHAVDTASSGPDALRRVQERPSCDVILCDVGMPGMNGWEVAARISRLAPRVAVYLLTGWALEISPDDQRRKWVRGILGKPIDFAQLRALLTSAPENEARTAP